LAVIGQLPANYNHISPKNERYVDDDVLVAFDVQNTGNREGDEAAHGCS
jgi:hypothetical protein